MSVRNPEVPANVATLDACVNIPLSTHKKVYLSYFFIAKR